VVEAADSERRRIERNLHDGAQQRLVALSLSLRLVQSRLATDADAASELLDESVDELAGATAELRELARGIHPAVLTERGLSPAIETLAARAPVPVEVVALPEERLPPVAEATAYFTVSEALTNVAKYARATHATVRLESEDGALVVEVRDDGVGGASASTGSGLSGLADRVGACDGSLSVESPPGHGTLVRAVLPLAQA
jgi:signal transduction histidine kinase